MFFIDLSPWLGPEIVLDKALKNCYFYANLFLCRKVK